MSPSNVDTSLLSICIPTYNRAGYLRKSLESLFACRECRDGRIEVVVSDNCSTDGTASVVAEFAKQYSNITYNRNEVNVRDLNFPISIRAAHGTYRKLSKDTMLYSQQFISALYALVEKSIETKPLICVTPTVHTQQEVRGMDATLQVASFWITDIFSFGIWVSDMPLVANMDGEATTSLWQVAAFLRCLSEKDQCVLVPLLGCKGQAVVGKDVSYGIFDIFYNNYLEFLRCYRDIGYLTSECYDYLERDLLFDFFCDQMISFQLNTGNWKRDSTNLEEAVLEAYAQKPYIEEFKKRYRKERIRRRVYDIIKWPVKKLISLLLA